MATRKSVLKLTHQEAVVKFAGAGTSALDLSADLVATGQALDGATQTVNVVAVTWTGETGSAVRVSRGGVEVLTLAGEAAAEMQFNEAGYVESENNTDDFAIAITGEAQVYITLRKVGGYATKIETAQFSVYDDTNAVGS